MKYEKYMGLDVHQAMTVAVVLDAEGKIILANDGGNRSGWQRFY